MSVDHFNSMRQLVREKDWSATPLGPARAWPASLRTAVDLLLDQPAPMIILWGPQLIQIYNDGYRPILAAKHPRALGQPTHDCWSEITAITEPLYLKVLAGSPLSLKDLPLYLDRGDGLREAYITVTYSPLKNDHDKVEGILALVHESTPRVLAEREREATLQRLHFAMEAGDLGSWEWDRATDRLHLSQRAAEMYGVSPNHPHIRNELRGLLHPAFREMARDTAEKAVAEHRDYAIEYRVLSAHGKDRWISAKGRGIYNDDGQLTRMIGVVQDITPRKEVEAELEALLQRETLARQEAEGANRSKDDFVATLSHELRSPLNAIVGWTQILARSTPDPATLAEGLEIIERNALAQSKMIEDLLDMNRIASGKMRLDLQRVDLRTLISAALESMRPAADTKQVRLTSSIIAHNPTVIADPARLQQILANLLTNAVKFTPGGGNVDLRLHQSDSLLRLSVIDSGIGIAPDLLPFVFDRFRQADSSASRKHGGLGLGLAIVKQLAELHGGNISVSSDGHGKGAAFTLTLPAAHPDNKIEIGQPPSSTAGELKGVRILVVDDEPDARILTRRILESAHASVTTAGSVEDALYHLRSHPFDILVSDIGMPGEDGYSLLRRLRAASPAPHIPAVALTAFSRPEDRIKALEAGFRLHAVKPIDPAELVTIVASLTTARST